MNRHSNRIHGFEHLFYQNKHRLPDIEYKSGAGDLRRSLESTVDEVVDIDPIDPMSLGGHQDTIEQTEIEPIVDKQPSIGESIISDEELVDENAPDGSPVGSTAYSSETFKVSSITDDYYKNTTDSFFQELNFAHENLVSLNSSLINGTESIGSFFEKIYTSIIEFFRKIKNFIVGLFKKKVENKIKKSEKQIKEKTAKIEKTQTEAENTIGKIEQTSDTQQEKEKIEKEYNKDIENALSNLPLLDSGKFPQISEALKKIQSSYIKLDAAVHAIFSLEPTDDSVIDGLMIDMDENAKDFDNLLEFRTSFSLSMINKKAVSFKTIEEFHEYEHTCNILMFEISQLGEFVTKHNAEYEEHIIKVWRQAKGFVDPDEPRLQSDYYQRMSDKMRKGLGKCSEHLSSISMSIASLLQKMVEICEKLYENIDNISANLLKASVERAKKLNALIFKSPKSTTATESFFHNTYSVSESLESYISYSNKAINDINKLKLSNCTPGTEDFKETMNTIWTKIVEFLRKIANFIKDLFGKFRNKNQDTQIEKIEKEIEKEEAKNRIRIDEQTRDEIFKDALSKVKLPVFNPPAFLVSDFNSQRNIIADQFKKLLQTLTIYQKDPDRATLIILFYDCKDMRDKTLEANRFIVKAYNDYFNEHDVMNVEGKTVKNFYGYLKENYKSIKLLLSDLNDTSIVIQDGIVPLSEEVNKFKDVILETSNNEEENVKSFKIGAAVNKTIGEIYTSIIEDISIISKDTNLIVVNIANLVKKIEIWKKAYTQVISDYLRNLRNRRNNVVDTGSESYRDILMDEFLGENEYTDDVSNDETTAEERYYNKAIDFFLESDYNELNSKTFKEASSILADKISTVYKDLIENVSPVVARLKEEIIEEVDKSLDGDGANDLAASLNVTIPTMTSINWNLISRLDTVDSIIRNAREIGKLRNNDIINFSASKATSHKWMQEIESTDIPENIEERIITTVETTVGENTEEAGITAVSNPDTPEGDVAEVDTVSTTESLVAPRLDDFLGENEGTDQEEEPSSDPSKMEGGEVIDTNDTDKQARANSVEEANANNKTLKTSVSREVYRIISKQAGYYRFVKSMYRAMHTMDTCKQIPELIRVVSTYPKVLTALESIDFRISDKDAGLLKQNVKTVRDVLYCVGLHLLVCRNYFDKNKVLVLDNNHLNPDALPTFSADGGDTSDIEKHLLHRYILPKQPIPNMGIRVSEIIRDKNKIAVEHVNRIDRVHERLKMSKNGAINMAYIKVLDKYLKSTPTNKLPAGMTLKNFISTKFNLVKATGANVTMTDSSIDECLYKFMLKLWYSDRPIYSELMSHCEHQYRYLFDTSADEITEEDKQTADAKAVADLVMNLMFDKFVVKM